MTHKDDLRRAKAMAMSSAGINFPASVSEGHSEDSWWEEIGAVARLEFIHSARAIRASDAEAGMVLVPRVVKSAQLTGEVNGISATVNITAEAWADIVDCIEQSRSSAHEKGADDA